MDDPRDTVATPPAAAAFAVVAHQTFLDLLLQRLLLADDRGWRYGAVRYKFAHAGVVEVVASAIMPTSSGAGSSTAAADHDAPDASTSSEERSSRGSKTTPPRVTYTDDETPSASSSAFVYKLRTAQ